MITRMIAIVLAWAFMAPAYAASADDPGSYAVRAPVTPMPGSSLQRLDLPAAVLVAVRSRDLADVRVFNANGQAVPIARSRAIRARQRQYVSLPVLPILGAADALAVTGVSLKIDDRQRARVVGIEGTPQAINGGKLLGILLDTRRIADPVAALSLDIAAPVGQPVTFTVESSADLKEWQPLADKVLYRTSQQAADTSIGFPEQDLQGRYLRVTWQSASRLLSPVVVHSARAVTQRDQDLGQAPRVVLLAPPMSDPHALEFTLPFFAPIAALEITAIGGDTLVPIRILGRNQPEEAWTPLASGSVSRITRDGRSLTNPPFALGQAIYRTFRIEADARTAGFASAPRLAARLESAQILFLATGPAPFTLAAGRADTPSAFLGEDDLRQANGSTTSSPPLVRMPDAADPVVSMLAVHEGPSWRRMALWAVLLAGTALLAAMVWLLTRRREPAA